MIMIIIIEGGTASWTLHACRLWLWNIPIHTATIAPHAPLTYLLSEKKILRYQLCSTCYAAVRINNCLKRTFVIKVTTTDYLMEAIMYLPLNFFKQIKHQKKKNKMVIICLPLNLHFLWWTKMNGTQRRVMLSQGLAKSMKNALYGSSMAKRAPLGLKQCQTAKKSSL